MRIVLYRKKIIMGVIIASLLVMSWFGAAMGNKRTSNNKKLTNTIIAHKTPLSLINHEPININSDVDFISFPGSGTAEDPYIIEGYNITTTAYADYGIRIRDTTKYFVIRNCYINGPQAGIYINTVESGTALVINNICENASIGIENDRSRYAKLINNTIIDSKGIGITLYDSEHTIITNNTLLNNPEDITIEFSSFCTISNNTMIKESQYVYSRYGLHLHYSSYSNISSNKFVNCGLKIDDEDLEGYDSYVVTNNMVNNKKLGFFTNLPGLIINNPDYGQIIVVNCSNIEISNQNITKTPIGIAVYYSNNALIKNNTCNYNEKDGIYLLSSEHPALINNTCIWNANGIHLWHSGDATIMRNFCKDNSVGILLEDSDSSVLRRNILLFNPGHGVDLEGSDDCMVFHNIFIRKGATMASQGYDNTGSNKWYDPGLKEGNYWSDWSGSGPYNIDGSTTSDLYPMIDIDKDELNESAEVLVYHTDPFVSDTDGDGMPDGWEAKYNLNPNVTDANGDLDNDNLTNLEEYKHGTDPTKADTDGDGYSDYEEIQAGTDPLDPQNYPGGTNTNSNTTNAPATKKITMSSVTYVILVMVALISVSSYSFKLRQRHP